jgi:hypothetical protein
MLPQNFPSLSLALSASLVSFFRRRPADQKPLASFSPLLMSVLELQLVHAAGTVHEVLLRKMIEQKLGRNQLYRHAFSETKQSIDMLDIPSSLLE